MNKWTYALTSISQERLGVINVTAVLRKDGEWATDTAFSVAFSDLKVEGKTRKEALMNIVKQQFIDRIEERTFIEEEQANLLSKTPSEEEI